MNDIVVFGHPSLTSKSENIINIDDYVVNLSKKMIDIMYAAPGVGLAACLLYTSPSPRDLSTSRMPSSA